MASQTSSVKEVTTTTEFKISNKGSDSAQMSVYRTTLPDYKTTSIYDSASLYGPGGRPKGMNSDRHRSLSGSSMSAAVSIRDSREREKMEIIDLNDRLAAYIEKVRFLSAQNKKMGSDLELYRARMGKDTLSTKSMYEGEVAEAHKLIVETRSEREDLEKQIRKIQAEISEYEAKFNDAVRGRGVDKERIDGLIVSFTSVEKDLNLFRRRVAETEGEVASLKKMNTTYRGLLSKLRTDVGQESLLRTDYQNKAQMLLEEIEFSRREQEQDLNDLHAMAARDTTPENREYFRSELAAAIRMIRAEYDQIMASSRADIESWYNLKVQEVHTTSNRHSMEQGYAKEEVKRLRGQLADLRSRLASFEGRNSLLEKQTVDLNYQLQDEQRVYEWTLKERDGSIVRLREECSALEIEMQRLLETKETLEAEIVTYRRLLEGEESRTGLRRLIQQVTSSTAEQAELAKKLEAERISRESGETTNKISFQGSAKGSISIQDAAIDGTFIVLENTNLTKEEQIGGWQIKRSVDNGPDVVFTFPKEFVLKPTKTVKVWARDQGVKSSPPDVLVLESADNFGMGINAKTVLLNDKGEERATHVQKTTQTTVIFA